jgi:hypothetical protein
MLKNFLVVLVMLSSNSGAASNLKSDSMCQEYLTGITTNVQLAERVGMRALRVSLNRIADTHPEYSDMATQVAFGTALDDDGHLRVGQHINYMCTQDGAVLFDLVYEVLLNESIRLSKKLGSKNVDSKAKSLD